MAYSKRKSIMIEQLVQLYDLDTVADGLGITVESVKRAIRYASKVGCTNLPGTTRSGWFLQEEAVKFNYEDFKKIGKLCLK
tara:strand:- start:258 stop:500 length:243 start_codon:yes stop_codon:yes gene_type:complete